MKSSWKKFLNILKYQTICSCLIYWLLNFVISGEIMDQVDKNICLISEKTMAKFENLFLKVKNISSFSDFFKNYAIYKEYLKTSQKK